MELRQVMQSLEAFGSEQTKKVFMRHGAREPFFGVKVQDMKKLQKEIKKDHALALALYDTGNSDAMYFAGLIAEPKKMEYNTLNLWAEKAYWYMISEFTVAWVAAESGLGWKIAMEWINFPKENIASAGWATLSCCLALTPDDQLNLAEVSSLLDRISTHIHTSQNRVKYTMNGFVISCATYVLPLHNKAKTVALMNGKIKVDVGQTDCKIPFAPEYIEKVEKQGKVGQKRKTVFC